MELAEIIRQSRTDAEKSAQAAALAVLRLKDLWPEVVGPMAAENSRPAAFSRGRLTVATEGPVWANELALLADEILRRLDDRLGPGVVRELRFKTATARRRKLTPSAVASPAPAGPAGPADRPDEARLRAELSRISDPELRESLFRLRLKIRPD